MRDWRWHEFVSFLLGGLFMLVIICVDAWWEKGIVMVVFAVAWSAASTYLDRKRPIARAKQ
jgi:hypothetical protein